MKSRLPSRRGCVTATRLLWPLSKNSLRSFFEFRQAGTEPKEAAYAVTGLDFEKDILEENERILSDFFLRVFLLPALNKKCWKSAARGVKKSTLFEPAKVSTY